jgi:MFS family permease
MDTTLVRSGADRPRPTDPRIVTRPLALLFVTSFGAMATFYLLLPVVPVYAAEVARSDAIGLSGGAAAGLSTGAMMLATVLLEPSVPALMRRCGNRSVIAAGLTLLGAPALLLATTPSLAVVLGACLARGAGLAILVVAGTAITAALVPPSRRGEAMGIYGLVVGVPGVLLLPLGLWVAGHLGDAPVFAAGGAVALLAIAAVPGLPHRTGHVAGHEPAPAVSAPAEAPATASSTVAFAAVTLAAGVIATFLPLAVPARLHGVAAFGLLAQSLLTPAARWAAGRLEARVRPGRLLGPALVSSALGVGLLVAAGSPAAVVAGSALFGLGFGLAQHASLLLMLDAVPREDYDRASALWNLAYDGGMGVGAVGFGLVAGSLGYPASFALTAAVLLLALVPIRR